MSSVVVLGLGNMGAALARALIKGGHTVTVWNRSRERAAPLLAMGAKLARSPADALAAGRLIIVCVVDCEASEAILSSVDAADALSGKALVEFSTGTTDQIYAQQRWVQDRGGRFIAGGLMAYPAGIGQPNTMIVYSGDKPAFEDCRLTLSSLGGSPRYLGADPGATIGAFATLATYVLGSVCVFLETAAVARHFGLSTNNYYALTLLAGDTLGEGILASVRQVADRNFDGAEASIDVALAGMRTFQHSFSETGIPCFMTEAIIKQLQLASELGHGRREMGQIVELLWNHHHGTGALDQDGSTMTED